MKRCVLVDKSCVQPGMKKKGNHELMSGHCSKFVRKDKDKDIIEID